MRRTPADPGAPFAKAPAIALVASAVCAFAIGCGGVSVLVHQQAIAASLSLSDRQLAFLFGPAAAAPLAVATLPIGALVDRRSRVWVMRICTLAYAGALVLMASASSYWPLAGGYSLAAVSNVGMTLAAYSLLSDYYAPAVRGRALALMETGSRVGPAAGFAVGGVLASLAGGEAGWRVAMLTVAAFVALAAALLWITAEPPRLGVQSERPRVRELLDAAFRHRLIFLVVVGGIVCAVIPEMSLLTWGGAYLAREFGMAPAVVGGAMGMVLLAAGFLSPFLGGVLADACHKAGGPRLAVRAMAALSLVGVALAFFPSFDSAATVVAIVAVYFVLLATIVKIGATVILVVAPGEVRASIFAAQTLLTLLAGVALPPMLVNWLSDGLGGPAHLGEALSAVSVVSGLAAVLLLGMGARWISRPRSAASAAAEATP